MAVTPTQLSAALTNSGLPTPSANFLTTILSSQRTQPPLPALLATAKHRLLSSDISIAPCVLAASAPSFPDDVASPQVREWKLGAAGKPVPVQVVAVEDLSRSRWEQLEAIEMQERGEMTKGREIIRVVESEDGGGGAGEDRGPPGGAPAMGFGAGGGPHRLVLQDVKGQTVYGLELKAVKGIGMGMSIGTKIMLCGATVARGLVLLEPETVMLLGGKIDSLHKIWVENRKKDLLAAVEGQP